MLVVFQDYIQDIHLLDEPTNQPVFSWARISVRRWIYEVDFPFYVGPHEPLAEKAIHVFPMAYSPTEEAHNKCRRMLFFSDGQDIFLHSYKRQGRGDSLILKLDKSIPESQKCSNVSGALVTLLPSMEMLSPITDDFRSLRRGYYGDAYASMEERLYVEPNLSRELAKMEELPDERLWFSLAESPDLVTWQNLASNPCLPMELTPWASWAAPRELLENPTFAMRTDYVGIDKMMSPLRKILEEKKHGVETVTQVEGP